MSTTDVIKTPRDRPGRSGSSMSTKQIAKAAVDGRMVRFTINSADVEGYVVGMDDFHWLVVNRQTMVLTMVHKASASLVEFSKLTLDDESQSLRSEVSLVGSAFFRYCQTDIFGKTLQETSRESTSA